MKALVQLKIGMAMCCVLAVVGCVQNSTVTQAGREVKSAVAGIAVLPVRPVIGMDESVSAVDETVLRNGSRVMDGLLQEMLAGNADVRFISVAQAGLTEGADHDLAAARRIAVQQGCNVVLETTLSRYSERVGGEYGVKQPAAVTFAYRLYEVNEGKVLCHGGFDEQQQSLMENMLALPKVQSRGVVWLTAEELARDGLKEKMGQCPFFNRK